MWIGLTFLTAAVLSVVFAIVARKPSPNQVFMVNLFEGISEFEDGSGRERLRMRSSHWNVRAHA